MRMIQTKHLAVLALLAIGCKTQTVVVTKTLEPVKEVAVAPAKEEIKLLADVQNLPKRKREIAESDLKRWSHLDIYKDTIPGMSVDRAYAELLSGKKFTKVVVGVIDSGIDIDHEDLKNSVWTNKKESANGIDDDNNGYVDDLHGWNFLGKTRKELLEFQRILRNKDKVSPEEYKRAQEAAEKKKIEDNQGKAFLGALYGAMKDVDNMLKKATKKKSYTEADVKALNSKDKKVMEVKQAYFEMIANGTTLQASMKELKDGLDEIAENEKVGPNVDYRKVVGDNPYDINDRKYGDAVVTGHVKADGVHGTHVSGIIAQARNNNLGGDGVASEQVEIMALRAVPDGDEYDKDIALAIRYAVDNGAKVINGSFGKYFSMNREFVIDAMKYAASKDVLLVIAAGNDAYDLDKMNKYPTDSYDGQPEFVDNTLIIGAIGPNYGLDMVASFTNYGKNDVDIYAPGMQIYATTPENTYQYLQGTSMASPNAAGVAALIRAYYPNLKASEVKKIIMDSGIAFPNLKIKIGPNAVETPFSEVSKTGKVVNAYNALLLAEKMSKK